MSEVHGQGRSNLCLRDIRAPQRMWKAAGCLVGSVLHRCRTLKRHRKRQGLVSHEQPASRGGRTGHDGDETSCYVDLSSSRRCTSSLQSAFLGQGAHCIGGGRVPGCSTCVGSRTSRLRNLRQERSEDHAASGHNAEDHKVGRASSTTMSSIIELRHQEQGGHARS